MEEKFTFDGKINLILGNMFSGKCLGINTPVIMFDGSIKLVQNIKINDYLMGDDSTPRKVLTINQGKSKLYRITPLFGDSYVVNENHILSLKCSDAYFQKKKLKSNIKNISVEEYLKKNDQFKKIFKGYRVGVNFEFKEININSYKLGLWLGDGMKSSEIVLRNKKIKKNLKFKNKLEKYDILNNKNIPFNYKTNNRKQRLLLLAGLIETNGSYNKNKHLYKIILNNKKIAEDVLYLIRSLGFQTHRNFQKRYSIYFTGNNLNEIQCTLNKKAININKNYNLLVPIKIDYIGYGDYYGFLIDSNHLFLLGDFTVTHNTSELIRRYKRYSIAGKKCLMIKYKNDTRYDKKMIVTHDNLKVEALVCEFLYEADNFINDYDIICVDEIQFYKDAHIFCDKWANSGKIIEACGLNGTFNRTSFDIINKLIPLADDIFHLKAICKETGQDAIYSKLNVDYEGTTFELIGGNEKYSAVDRKTYFQSESIIKSDENQKIKEFVIIYMNSKKIKIDEKILSSLDIYIHENINKCTNHEHSNKYYIIANSFLNYMNINYAG